jgi:predicted tellurium resistance membrane protein TerC
MANQIVPLLTLIWLEVILGIYNIVNLSVLPNILHPEQRLRLRYRGIALCFFANNWFGAGSLRAWFCYV